MQEPTLADVVTLLGLAEGERDAALAECARLKAEVEYERQARQSETNRADDLRAQRRGRRGATVSEVNDWDRKCVIDVLMARLGGYDTAGAVAEYRQSCEDAVARKATEEFEEVAQRLEDKVEALWQSGKLLTGVMEELCNQLEEERKAIQGRLSGPRDVGEGGAE